MLSCACSVKALELFVKDFAGLRLRQQRPHVQFRQERLRRFGTRSPFRQLESAFGATSAGRTGDGFVPFEDAREDRGQGLLGKGEQEKEIDDDWHAEVEIAAPGVREVDEASATQLVGLGDGAFPSSEHDVDDVEPAGDDASLRDLHPPVSLATTRDTQITAAPGALDTVPKSKTARPRLARKHRRQKAGTYKPGAQEQNEEPTDDGRLQNVLEKIEALPGPNAAKKKPWEERSIRSDKDKKAGAKGNADSKFNRADSTRPQKKLKPENWQVQKAALEEKFGESGWQPRKRLSPDTLEGIRALHSSDPASYNTATLSEHFKITPEAIRRILKAKWRPSQDEIEDRRQRWEKRGVRKWEDMASQGVRPPAKWRAMGIKGNAESGMREGKREKSKDDQYVQWEDEGYERPGHSFAERIL
ncbi:Required for respiratory growth protein 9 mitochondrial [Vermiconidia calcicola]|uniref:Required for respiratory growth protein 9 mitochondrial n=1 Tax=Vermiconidia calcicola TaxID=1690605 RepID=A0ACC3MDS3_9PEZI|nr:Required for respiratory growth protein 9 mitochondrial [Vermiconidia calcicola]